MTLRLAYSAPVTPEAAPSSVTQFPAADPDTPMVAAWFLRHGWTAMDACRAGLDRDLSAAMAVLEAITS